MYHAVKTKASAVAEAAKALAVEEAHAATAHAQPEAEHTARQQAQQQVP